MFRLCAAIMNSEKALLLGETSCNKESQNFERTWEKPDFPFWKLQTLVERSKSAHLA
jgi:hypothetical protein